MATASVPGLEWRRRTEWRVLVVLAVGVAGVVATAVTVWACAHSPVLVDPTETALLRATLVAPYVAVGAYTWWRRPDSRLGPLLAGSGFLYAATSLNASRASLVFTLGMVVWAAWIVYIGYVYLAFPRGGLESQRERRLIVAFALSTALVWGLILVLSPTLPPGSDFTDCGTRCPHNPLQVVDGHAVTGLLNAAYGLVAAITAIGIAILVFNKARSSAYLRRRTMTPLAVVLIASIAEGVTSLFVAHAPPETRDTLRIIAGALSLAVPAAMLIGQVRGRVFAVMSLGQLAVQAGREGLTPAAVQRLVGDAVEDSTLRLALWAPERAGYLDIDGQPLELPRDTRARAVTRVTRNGRPVAALIHDPTLDTDSDVVEGLAATSLMLLENTRLVEELRESRSRIVETAERERRRLERDLHDGAQQRLVAIQVRLAMARELADNEDLAEQLDATQRDAEAAVHELRALAHGIYPTILHDLGPAAALRDLSTSFPVPIKVTDDGIGRSSDAIEAAIYFCAREAIQNTAKHAGPDANVAVTLAHHQDTIEFTVTDNGAGLPTERGTDGVGIASMRDRIEAVGGQFEIVSAPGQGTFIHGTIRDLER